MPCNGSDGSGPMTGMRKVQVLFVRLEPTANGGKDNKIDRWKKKNISAGRSTGGCPLWTC